ncbi:unnamed protein product [Macrosiphum euphorbiae]|uniref:Uncharacterized protein n=1 Tax=Macrosiphum euphorbiae TaxID=13131 RepID=A0AAV0W0H9_9HEMI|nr:unnamed protein product [Macrosiphum euphorbiae]
MNSSIKDFFTTSRHRTNINDLGVKSVVATSSQVNDQSVSSVECSTSTNDSKETEDNNHSTFDIMAYIGKQMSSNEEDEVIDVLTSIKRHLDFSL